MNFSSVVLPFWFEHTWVTWRSFFTRTWGRRRKLSRGEIAPSLMHAGSHASTRNSTCTLTTRFPSVFLNLLGGSFTATANPFTLDLDVSRLETCQKTFRASYAASLRSKLFRPLADDVFSYMFFTSHHFPNNCLAHPGAPRVKNTSNTRATRSSGAPSEQGHWVPGREWAPDVFRMSWEEGSDWWGWVGDRWGWRLELGMYRWFSVWSTARSPAPYRRITDVGHARTTNTSTKLELCCWDCVKPGTPVKLLTLWSCWPGRDQRPSPQKL